MQLTKEMESVFFCLLQEDGWITSDALAEQFHWSRNKLLQVMRGLMEELGELCVIDSQKNKGYCLRWISDEMKKFAFQNSYHNEGHFSLNERRAMLSLELLFRDDYVSMDELAEFFYLSKTTVFEEMRHLKRWFGRISKLDLEVAPQRGVRVHGSEYDKRLGCVNFAGANAFKLIHLSQEEIFLYEQTISKAASVLRDELQLSGSIISGEDFSSLLRYIAVSQLRSGRGWIQEDMEDSASVLSEDFFTRLSGATGYILTASEERGFQKLTRQINQRTISEALDADAHILKPLEGFLKRKLRLDDSQQQAGQSVKTWKSLPLFYRADSGIHHPNFYDKEILYAHPLSVHLIQQAFREVYHKTLPRVDRLNFAAYLGSILSQMKYHASVRVLLVGNQDFQILKHIREYVLQVLPFIPERFDMAPAYLLTDDLFQTDNYDLFLTTEPSVMLHREHCILIPVIMTEPHKRQLYGKLNRWNQTWQERQRSVLDERYPFHLLEKLGSLEELLPEELLAQATIYALNQNTLCIFCTAPGIETDVRRIALRISFPHEFRPITRILIFQYNEEEPGILEFFHQARLLFPQ